MWLWAFLTLYTTDIKSPDKLSICARPRCPALTEEYNATSARLTPQPRPIAHDDAAGIAVIAMTDAAVIAPRVQGGCLHRTCAQGAVRSGRGVGVGPPSWVQAPGERTGGAARGAQAADPICVDRINIKVVLRIYQKAV